MGRPPRRGPLALRSWQSKYSAQQVPGAGPALGQQTEGLSVQVKAAEGGCLEKQDSLESLWTFRRCGQGNTGCSMQTLLKLVRPPVKVFSSAQEWL